MANNLPTQRTFKFENYPGAPQWFANFLTTLTLFTDPIYQILDGGVGYQNLTIPQIVTKTITAPAAGNVTFSFTNPLSIVPSSIIVGNCYQNGQPSLHPTSAATCYWHFSQGTIYIDQITGLTAATTYVVTLQVS